MDLQNEFHRFMEVVEEKLLDLDISLFDYPIDHVCYRASTIDEFYECTEFFKSRSVLYTRTFFHERSFMMYVLREPLVYKTMNVYYLEFAEPGGSDDYDRGFQHIEFYINKGLRDIVSDQMKLGGLLFEGKHGDEVYLKWPDKTAVKITQTPLITKSLTGINSEIHLVK